MGFFDKLTQPRQVKDFYIIKRAIEDGLSGRLKAMAILIGDEIEQEVNEIEGEMCGRKLFLEHCQGLGVFLYVMTLYISEIENFLTKNQDNSNDGRLIATQFYVLLIMLQVLMGAPREILAEQMVEFDNKHGVDTGNCGLHHDDINLILTPIKMKTMHLFHR